MAIYSGFSHYKCWFSIAMLVYQGVYVLYSYLQLPWISPHDTGKTNNPLDGRNKMWFLETWKHLHPMMYHHVYLQNGNLGVSTILRLTYIYNYIYIYTTWFSPILLIKSKSRNAQHLAGSIVSVNPTLLQLMYPINYIQLQSPSMPSKVRQQISILLR